MQNAVENFRGIYELSITGAEPEKFINLCAVRGVCLSKCKSVNMAEFNCIMPRRYLNIARKCAAESSCEIKILAQRGASFRASKLKKRHVLINGILMCTLLLTISNLYIWDVDIVGNDNVESSEILNVLEENGVYIGANWVGFSSDQIRSEVLADIPELSYLTVNVSGSRATVIVRERIETLDPSYDVLPCDVVSKKSGVVTELNAFRGTPLVGVGSPIMEGDVLISGVVSGYGEEAVPNFVSAYGEVKAKVEYEFLATESLVGEEKVYSGRENKKFAINFGENRLNLYLNTGIYLSTCDTIYKEHRLEFSDLFTLPISLSTETRRHYEVQEFTKDEGEVILRLEEILIERLKSEMHIDGEIISTEFETIVENDNVYVTLKAVCEEEIGEKTYQNFSIQSGEEISIDAGKNNDG